MANSTVKKTGLYADLLADPGSATISGAPVKYEFRRPEDAAIELQKKKDANALKFQPIKRPQQKQNKKPKAKPAFSFANNSSSSVSTSSPDKQVPSSAFKAASAPKNDYNKWASLGDEDLEYAQQPRERGGRKRKKNKTKQEFEHREVNYDELYEPDKPNDFFAYKHSAEEDRDREEWWQKLHYRPKSRGSTSGSYISETQKKRSASEAAYKQKAAMMGFAPPTESTTGIYSSERGAVSDDDAYSPPPPDPIPEPDMDDEPYDPPPAFAPPDNADDPSFTGKGAYGRRMSDMLPPGGQNRGSSSLALPSGAANVPTSSPIPAATRPVDVAERMARVAAFQEKVAKMKAANAKAPQSSAPASQTTQPVPATEVTPSPRAPPAEQQASGTISRAPVRYDAPPPPPPAEPQTSGIISRAPVRYGAPPPPPERTDAELDAAIAQAEKEDQTPTAGQPRVKGKALAARMLEKMGWEKGTGLGAEGNEGITTALQVDKPKDQFRKRRSDAEGGGFRQPANMGRIVGGKRRKIESTGDDDGLNGPISEVVRLEGMLKDMDAQYEVEENNLQQVIGSEMSTKYGNVERIFVWREDMGGNNTVFVKFTSQLSALRAVQGMDGTEFVGNPIKARYFSVEKFNEAEYA